MFSGKYLSYGIMELSIVGIGIAMIWEFIVTINNTHLDFFGKAAAFGLLVVWTAFLFVLLYITLDFAKDNFSRRKVR